MTFGYNLGATVVGMQLGFETYKTGDISLKIAEIDQETEHLDLIRQLLAKMNTDRKRGDINYSGSPEMMDLLDQVRKIAPEAIAPGCCQWKGEEIGFAVDNLERAARAITTRINQQMSGLSQEYQERNEITKINDEILKLYIEHIRGILQRLRS